MRLRLFLSLVMCLVFAFNASAETYYADMSISIDETGDAVVSGSTNHPLLETSGTSEWTSKKGDVWLFNLTLPPEDVFSDYIYEIDLPAGSSVNYVRSNGEFRITSLGDRIRITGIGEDEAFSVVIQYQVNEAEPRGIGYEYLLIVGMLLLVLGIIIYRYLKGTKQVSPPVPLERPTETPKLDVPVPDDLESYNLTDRQKEIYKLLKDVDKPVNQSYICEKLDLPKSSVSRNIDSLERKALVTKVREGMSTLISVKDR